MNEEQKIYTEEHIILIKPLKANRIWNEKEFEKIESWTEEGEKLIILREKIIKE